MTDSNRQAAVYDLVIGKLTIYVGCTRYPNKRMRDHLRLKRLPTEARMVIVEWHETEQAAKQAEKRRIKSLRPPLNRSHARKTAAEKEAGCDAVDKLAKRLARSSRRRLEKILASMST